MRISAVKVMVKALEGLILEAEKQKKEAIAREDWGAVLAKESYGNGLEVALMMVIETALAYVEIAKEEKA